MKVEIVIRSAGMIEDTIITAVGKPSIIKKVQENIEEIVKELGYGYEMK